MIPFAVMRSAGLVRSEIALKEAPGKTPSPMPNIKRMTSSAPKPQARPVKPVKTDHTIMAIAMIFRVPILSANTPPGSCENAYAMKKADINSPSCVWFR